MDATATETIDALPQYSYRHAFCVIFVCPRSVPSGVLYALDRNWGGLGRSQQELL